MSQILRLGIVGAMLWLSACQVSTDVTLTVAEDGSGTIEVAVGLDDEAVAQIDDIDSLFVTEDLVAAGWDVSPATVDDDKLTRIRVSRAFATPTEAEQLFAQIAGDTGVFEGMSLGRDDSFTTTTYRFEARADLSDGLDLFSDADLTAALDGEPLGESVEAIEERFGAPLAELFSLTVTVDLPGEVVDTSADGTTSWTPVVGGDPVAMSATTEVTDRTPLLLVGVAALSVVSAVGFVVVRRRRQRPEPA